ncbi:uncharacterized protein [Hetaerina americana]|uniref:uncharacterized protein n=1 Tax=Hetaerina americana TaxID=62018 RepID=UPI003A7F1E29
MTPAVSHLAKTSTQSVAARFLRPRRWQQRRTKLMERRDRPRKTPRDVFWATWPLFLTSQVLGVAPFPLKYGRGRVETTRVLLNYSRFAFLLAFLSSIYSLPEMVQYQLQESNQMDIPLNAYVNASWWFMCILVGTAGSICFYNRRDRVQQFLLDMVRFDAISKLCKSLRHRRTRRLLVLNFFCLCFLALLGLLHQVYSALTEALQDSNLLTLLGLYWLLVIIVLDSQFSTLAWMLKERFRMVNDGVSLVLHSGSDDAWTPLIVSAIGIGEDVRVLGTKFYPAVRGKNALSSYVRVLATLNMSLFRLVRTLCQAYGSLVLVQTCSNLVQITFHLYYYIEEMMGLLDSDDTVYIVGDLAVWCCPYIVGISMILASSHITAKEVQCDTF